jgi:hypothetical protein
MSSADGLVSKLAIFYARQVGGMDGKTHQEFQVDIAL